MTLQFGVGLRQQNGRKEEANKNSESIYYYFLEAKLFSTVLRFSRFLFTGNLVDNISAIQSTGF